MDKGILFIIVTYNSMKWLSRCLDSVVNLTILSDIFIVDNGSIDGTQEYIKSHYPQAMFHQTSSNLGFGRANNVGLQYAIDNGYDYVYLLNQDAWIMPKTMEKLIDIHQRYPEYGILSPFHLQANMKHLDRNFAQNVCSWHSNPYLLEDLYLDREKDVYSVPDVMAAHWLISRECFCKVGGFSPTFPHYGEDTNYADRTLYHGFKVGIVPMAQAVHDREDRVITKEKDFYMTYIKMLILLSKPINYKTLQMGVILRIAKLLLIQMYEHRSIVPFKYIFRILKEYSQIKKNTKESIMTSAFLCLLKE